VFQNGLVAVIDIIGRIAVNLARHEPAKRVISNLVCKTGGSYFGKLLVPHVVISKSRICIDLVVVTVGYCGSAYRCVLIDAVGAVAGCVYTSAIASPVQSVGERTGQVRRHWT